MQRATRLLRPGEWNLVRRLTFAIAVGWLPLVLITAVFNYGGLISLLTDYRVHARMLIAVPILLFGEVLMETRFRNDPGPFCGGQSPGHPRSGAHE